MKTVLVTGGAGFIGSNFVSYIRQKHPAYRLLVVDALTYAGLPNFDQFQCDSAHLVFYHGNVCDAHLMDRLVGLSDVVVHFAAETHVTRSIYDDRVFFETDVLGTQTLATAVVRHRRHIERFIHISTSEVYGTAEIEPMTETHPLNATNPYAAAKAGADRLVYAYWRTYGIPVVIVRPFNNYGPRQHPEKVIPNFVICALANEPLTVHGSGAAARDWVHVSDHCEALDRILHSELATVVGQAINVGTGVATDVHSLAEKILDLMPGSRSRIEHIQDRPGQVAKHIAGFG